MLRVELTARRDEVGRAVDALRAACREHDVPAEVGHDLCLAADEILANSMMHGYDQGCPGPIVLEAHFEEAEVRLVVADHAPPFDPFSLPLPDLAADPDAGAEGGMGLRLVRATMDEVGYERRGEQNRVTLMRRIHAG